MTFELLLGGPHRTWYTILHVSVDVILFSIRTLPLGFHHLYICHVFPFSFFIDFHNFKIFCQILIHPFFNHIQSISFIFKIVFCHIIEFKYPRFQVFFFIRRVLFGEGYHIPARGCLFRKPFYLMLLFLPLNTYSVSYITNCRFCIGVHWPEYDYISDNY